MYNLKPKSKHSIYVWLVLRIPETLHTQCGTHMALVEFVCLLSTVCLVFLHIVHTHCIWEWVRWVKIPACSPSRQPWPFGPQCLSSSKETQWVSGQRDTRFINLQRSRKKKFIVKETKGHLITTKRSSSKLEIFWWLIDYSKAATFGNMWCFWILPFHSMKR